MTFIVLNVMKKVLDSECVECGKIGRGYKTDYQVIHCDECLIL